MWYYISGETRFGPVSQDELVELIRSEKLGPSTLVWRQSFDDWKRLDALEELAVVLAELPPPAPGTMVPHIPLVGPAEVSDDIQSSQVLVEEPLAGPWARFLARTLDVWLITVLLFMAVGLYASHYAPELLVRIENANETALGLAALPVTLLILALCMSVFGTTVGKALLGIRVKNLTGASALKFHISREMGVWVQGYAFGFPLIALVTLFFQHKRVVAHSPASYDEGRARVECGRISALRWLATLTLAAGMFVGVVALIVAAEEDTRQVDLVQSWTNPITGGSTSFSRTWASTPIEAESGDDLFYFVSDYLMAEALFGVEEINSSLAPLDYAEALERALSDDITLVGQWSSLEVQGSHALRKSGSLASDRNHRVQVTIVLRQGRAWRTIIFARGRELTDTHFEAFVNAALSTI
ncbi:RDD family protein [Mesorhizobium sp. YM1C-6-2]|uniref:RDD family protein n=1 Tax=Mesorhizobium sp. YM1C-6-2 TaxID=1827501 RepID=UPI00160040FA|nr:RDD family protein [Mesorhizobium sp. YM1C-6-2]